MHAEFTAAILLVVEVILFQQLVAPLLEPAFPPILFPEEGIRIERGGTASGFIDLLQAFPARRGEGSGEYGETMLGGVAGCLCQAQCEAL